MYYPSSSKKQDQTIEKKNKKKCGGQTKRNPK